MSGLHTRGYRPAPGERWSGEVIAPRRAWRVCWRNTREFGPVSGLRLGRCAAACLEARSLPDWLGLSPGVRAMIRAYRRRVRRRSASEVS